MDNTAPEPNNFLNWVDIKNFKSIKDLHLDCKRVNVFIGKPNVGKSNILEGLGLLGGSYDENKFSGGSIRYQQLRDLFLDHEANNEVQVLTDKTRLLLRKGEYFRIDRNEYDLSWESVGLIEKYLKLSSYGEIMATRTGAVIEYDPVSYDNKDDTKFAHIDSLFGPIKKYDFDSTITKFESLFSDFLLPPYGINLYEVVKQREDITLECIRLFQQQKLDFVFGENQQTFLLQHKKGPRVFQNEFFSVADTFRRYMFYITAIESNKNSVIVFEEPEVHSFPPYVKAMAHRMVSSDTNQFFVSTHSPYLLQTLISELDESELAVFITYYQDYQTHVRQLTADELQEAQDLGIDLFYNLSRYEPNA